eukprot:scaffold112726_cov20-Tisochrysis_lutea.AAC.5
MVALLAAATVVATATVVQGRLLGLGPPALRPSPMAVPLWGLPLLLGRACLQVGVGRRGRVNGVASAAPAI